MWVVLVGLVAALFGVLWVFRLVWWASLGRFSLKGLDLSGRNILITGHTSGIGLETARELSKAGANLWLLCRKTKLGEEEAAKWEGKGVKKVIHCDLSSLASVRAAAAEVLASCPHLHVLICNAGMGGTGTDAPVLTADGLEMVMASNYFGHFLLTRLLLPKMGKGSRIVNVSSLMHKYTTALPMENLAFAQTYTRGLPYVYSKLAQILSTRELAAKLRSRGIVSTSLHPGFVNTAIFARRRTPITVAISLLSRWFKNPLEGAQTSLYLAASPEVEGVSGAYFADCRPTSPSLLALRDDVAAELWAESSRLVGLPDQLQE